MSVNKTFLSVLLSILLLAGTAVTAQAVTVLPEVDRTVDGIPVTSQYEDFYTYPAKLMIALAEHNPTDPNMTWTENYWDVVTGTGNLDVLVLAKTGSGTNNRILKGLVPKADEMTFETAILNGDGGVTGATTGAWGLGLKASGPVTVDQVVEYLRTYTGDDTASIPVFSFDMTEPNASIGAVDSLKVAGRVCIVHPDYLNDIANLDNYIVYTWSLDGDENGHWDDPSVNSSAWVDAPGELSITGTSGYDYFIDNNTGSEGWIM